MNLNRTLVSLLLLAAWGVTAQAQGAKTRAQVKAELAEAIRTGDMPAGGESGLKLNEICPSCYPAKPAVAGKSREQVRAELAEAIRTGDVSTGGESANTLNALAAASICISSIVCALLIAERAKPHFWHQLPRLTLKGIASHSWPSAHLQRSFVVLFM